LPDSGVGNVDQTATEAAVDLILPQQSRDPERISGGRLVAKALKAEGARSEDRDIDCGWLTRSTSSTPRTRCASETAATS
jgi:hypothetical protein